MTRERFSAEADSLRFPGAKEVARCPRWLAVSLLEVWALLAQAASSGVAAAGELLQKHDPRLFEERLASSLGYTLQHAPRSRHFAA